MGFSIKVIIVIVTSFLLSSCDVSEKPVVCSVIQGLQGFIGKDGRDGLPGPKGDSGSTGHKGDQGMKGDRGTPGKAGPQGQKGDQGNKGVQGLKGEKGEEGPLGATGAAGIPGAKGGTGAPGIQGVKGDKGNQGEHGSKGEKGQQGLSGQKGDKGDGIGISDSALQQKLSSIEEQLRSLQQSVSAQKKALLFIKGTSSGNKLFLTNGEQLTYEESKAICNKAGGHLASPQNAHENQAVLQIALEHKQDTYLGINDKQTEGTFRGPNGEKITYSNWKPREPNQAGEEDCVEMFSDGKWNDRSCDLKRLVICEFS